MERVHALRKQAQVSSSSSSPSGGSDSGKSVVSLPSALRDGEWPGRMSSGVRSGSDWSGSRASWAGVDADGSRNAVEVVDSPNWGSSAGSSAGGLCSVVSDGFPYSDSSSNGSSSGPSSSNSGSGGPESSGLGSSPLQPFPHSPLGETVRAIVHAWPMRGPMLSGHAWLSGGMLLSRPRVAEWLIMASVTTCG